VVVKKSESSKLGAVLQNATKLGIPIVDFPFIEHVAKKGTQNLPDFSIDDKMTIIPSIIDPILENSEWMGVATDIASKKKFPFVFTVFVRDNQESKIWGQINWPTKSNAITKYHGQIRKGNIINFIESDIISGDVNQVTLPCTYTGTIEDKIIKGNSTNSEFTLNFTRITPSIPFPFLQSGATFEGFATEHHPFFLQISSKNGNKFSGSVTWPELSTTTKVSGSIKSNKLKFEENQYLQGDSCIIPMNYSGLITQKNEKNLFVEIILEKV